MPFGHRCPDAVPSSLRVHPHSRICGVSRDGMGVLVVAAGPRVYCSGLHLRVVLPSSQCCPGRIWSASSKSLEDAVNIFQGRVKSCCSKATAYLEYTILSARKKLKALIWCLMVCLPLCTACNGRSFAAAHLSFPSAWHAAVHRPVQMFKRMTDQHFSCRACHSLWGSGLSGLSPAASPHLFTEQARSSVWSAMATFVLPCGGHLALEHLCCVTTVLHSRYTTPQADLHLCPISWICHVMHCLSLFYAVQLW